MKHILIHNIEDAVRRGMLSTNDLKDIKITVEGVYNELLKKEAKNIMMPRYKQHIEAK